MGSSPSRLVRGAATLLCLSAIVLCMAVPAAARDRPDLRASSAASDYLACWARFSSDLQKAQQLSGATNQDLEPVVVNLNASVGYLDQAQLFLAANQTNQASAAIASANAVLATAESQIAALQAHLELVAGMEVAAGIIVAAVAVLGIFLLVRWKRRHDRELRERFLKAELDYSNKQD